MEPIEPEAAAEAVADSASTPEAQVPTAAVEPALPPPFPVVGIGASAGGLEAIEALIRRLSSDGMAFVVIQHLAPGHESMLTDILARATSLRVITIVDGVQVAPNTIYVTPPDADVSITAGILRLVQASDQVPRLSIDAFFRSLAQDFGTMAIGVVLSGAGSDGTLGLRAIRACGGIAFVQEPSTASQGSMPQSAVDAGCADFCLTPAQIGDELMRLSAHPFVAKKPPQYAFKKDSLNQLIEQLRKTFGVDFSAYKVGTIGRRIERRMALQKLDKIEDYVRFVEDSGDELAILYSDLLIGVTGFFRDQEPFEILKNVVFPRLLDKRSSEHPVRIWVPGCATGEEAYSLAMCLLEYLDGRAGLKVQIFATDIDDHALAKARQAHYPQSIEADVSPPRLQRFFTHQEKGYRVSRQVRDMVVFARHNVGKDPPFSRLDLISCRNVLIYMQASLQRKVLRVFHYALNPAGFLLLGTSESVGEASELFSLLDRKLKIYIKKDVRSVGVLDFGFPTWAKIGEPVSGTPMSAVVERRPGVSLQQLADRKVLEKFGPPGLLLDDNGDVLQFRGQMGPYLAPAPGAATLNALKLIRPEFLVELRTSLVRAGSEGLPCTSQPVHLRSDFSDVVVTLDVMPLHESGADKKCFLVLFRDSPSTVPSVPMTPEDQRSARERDLEREVLVNKEYLQNTMQEAEAANEELQSANEELQSSNEELQSSNEELETSKEELQSTNEELATVNEELQNRMGQLSVANDDLQNVLSGLSAAFVIVGMDLRIRRFSADAERLLNLIPSDVGRPIGYLWNALNAPQGEAVVVETINTLREREQRVRCSDGLWYSARVVPYRNGDHAIRGALIEFLRAPASRKIGEPVEINEFVAKILSTLPDVLMLLDAQLRVVWVNRAFLERFATGDEILGRTLEDVWAGRTTDPQLWRAIEDTASGGRPYAEVWVADAFGRKSEQPMKFSVRRIAAEGDRPALALVVMEEDSPRGHA